jgi:hypothetical protein
MSDTLAALAPPDAWSLTACGLRNLQNQRLELDFSASLQGPAVARLLQQAQAEVGRLENEVRQRGIASPEYAAFCAARERLADAQAKRAEAVNALHVVQDEQTRYTEGTGPYCSDWPAREAEAQSRVGLLDKLLATLQQQIEAAKTAYSRALHRLLSAAQHVLWSRDTYRKELAQALFAAHAEELGNVIVHELMAGFAGQFDSRALGRALLHEADPPPPPVPAAEQMRNPFAPIEPKNVAHSWRPVIGQPEPAKSPAHLALAEGFKEVGGRVIRPLFADAPDTATDSASEPEPVEVAAVEAIGAEGEDHAAD